MKKQYRIINKGKGVLKITSSNLNEVEQPITELTLLKEYIDSQDINILNQATTYTDNSINIISNDLANLKNPDIVLKSVTPTIEGLNVSAPADSFEWRINQVVFDNTPALAETLTAAADGFYRKDVLLGTNTNTYLIIEGVEGDESVIPPSVFPTGTILLGVIDVFGATVGGFSVNDTSRTYVYGNGGETDYVEVTKLGTTLEIMQATSITGFTIPAVNLHYGKDYYLRNSTGNLLTLKSAVGTNNIRFYFPDGDFIVPVNNTIHLKYLINGEFGGLGYFTLVGLSIKGKADKTYVDAQDLLKEDKNQKGIANGYAPLNEFTKIALQYLNVVNNLVDGGTNSLLTAEQGKQLQLQVSVIQNILFSDNVNLDTVQEIVDALETVQSYIDTILVNDLTTGGTTKALTAEMGKLLQTNKVDKVTGKSLIADSEITRLTTLSNYTHPANHPPSIITQDASNRFVTDAEKTTWNAKQGALGFTPENVSNKQNSLAVDGTNTKYPTVTAINTGLDLKANLNHPGLIGNVKTTGDQGVSGEKFFSSVINFTKTTIAARYEGPINLNVNTLTSSVYAGAVVIGSLNGSFAFASGSYGRAIFSTVNIGATARTFTFPDKNGTVAMISDMPVALSGSYTPIVTINSNLSALSTSGAVWTRVDKIVTVTVSIDFTGTNAYTDTGFSISVPIPMSLQNTVALRNLGLATFITPLVPAICTNVQEDFPNVNINFFIESVIHSYTGTVTFSYILP